MKSGFRLGKIDFSINNSIKSSNDFFLRKRIALFSLDENSNSKNSSYHLKNFETYYDRIKKLGIHDIYCCALNSFENLKSNFNSKNIKKIKILPDEKGFFTDHLGMLNFDKEKRSKFLNRNYMAIITDGIIEKWWEEAKKDIKNPQEIFFSETIAETCINYLSGTE